VNKQTIKDVDVEGKRVLVRAMLNVPIKDGVVGDRMRLEAALPTLQYLLERGASLVLISHHSHEGQSLAPVAQAMSEVLGRPVAFASDCVGPAIHSQVTSLQPGNVLMLENLRFHPEEEANDEAFASELARYGQLFVQDDFTTCHRKHASIVGIPEHLTAVAGLQVEKEVDTINQALDNPSCPLVAVAGGAKISTKVPIVSYLLSKVDSLFIGGAMANTFLLAEGKNIGTSLVEPTMVVQAKQILENAAAAGKTVILPVDAVVATDVTSPTDVRVLPIDQVGATDNIADIGPASVALLKSVLSPQGTVIWNGPMGIAEQEVFASGTKGVAEAIIDSGASSIIGGGDTADYVDGHGLSAKFSFVSTGGGASLELMSGNPLPGVEALIPAVS
jgi:phosphoglycerate kinase